MEIDKLITTLIGLATMAFVYWFFLMKKEQKINVSGSVDITVNGGYSPEIITIHKGEKTQLSFLRTDPSTCLEEVVIADFKVRKYLPLNQKVLIEITPDKTGEFNFTCGMNMFHGKIIVE